MRENFGKSARELASTLLFAGFASHDRALSAHAASGLEVNNVYGTTFHLALCDEIALGVSRIPGSILFKPENASYNLLLIDRILILPMRAREGPLLVKDLSALRKRLLSPNRAARAPAQLAFAGFEAYYSAEESLIDGIEKTVVVRYYCERHAGLQNVIIGEASILNDIDTLVFSYEERLPLNHAIRSTAVGEVPKATVKDYFSAPIPVLNLELYEDENVRREGY